MSGSTFGKIFRITTWGESHGSGIGVVIDGCPSGISLNEEDIQIFLDRRKPGQSKFTTRRSEEDTVEILSGIFEGKTTGTPISLLIPNTSQRSADYSDIAQNYRPGHADYTFDEKYGYLTSFPTNVGTGLRAAVVLHLPMLSKNKNFNSLVADMGRFGTRSGACTVRARRTSAPCTRSQTRKP